MSENGTWDGAGRTDALKIAKKLMATWREEQSVLENKARSLIDMEYRSALKPFEDRRDAALLKVRESFKEADERVRAEFSDRTEYLRRRRQDNIAIFEKGKAIRERKALEGYKRIVTWIHVEHGRNEKFTFRVSDMVRVAKGEDGDG